MRGKSPVVLARFVVDRRWRLRVRAGLKWFLQCSTCSNTSLTLNFAFHIDVDSHPPFRTSPRVEQTRKQVGGHFSRCSEVSLQSHPATILRGYATIVSLELPVILRAGSLPHDVVVDAPAAHSDEFASFCISDRGGVAQVSPD